MPMKIPLRDAFATGKAAFGIWNTMPGASVVRTMASTPGISVSYIFIFTICETDSSLEKPIEFYLQYDQDNLSI